MQANLTRTGTIASLDFFMAHAIYVRAALDLPFSYAVEGARFSPAFQAKQWDGRKRLFTLRAGKATFPCGLSPLVETELKKAGFTVEVRDLRVEGARSPSTAFGGPTPYPHQSRAWKALSEAYRAGKGGVLSMPVRSGKTMTAAMAIATIRRRALFVTASDMLTEQGRSALSSFLPEIKVTSIGGGQGEDQSGDVVVASIQTLAARMGAPWFAAFADAGWGVLIADETHHHLVGGASDWRDAIIAIKARCKYGITGTLNEKDPAVVLWSKALFGEVLIRVTVPEMTAAGVLVPCDVRFLKHDAPMISGEWARDTYSKAVVKCAPRNKVLAEEAARLAHLGHRVLVDVGRVGHARELGKLLRGLLPSGKLRVLTGSADDAERAEAVGALASRDAWIIVGTLLGEGIDLPSLTVICNGESGKESCSAVQRLRNLTASPGKERALVIDVADEHQRHLQKQYKQREKMYRKLGFTVEK